MNQPETPPTPWPGSAPNKRNDEPRPFTSNEMTRIVIQKPGKVPEVKGPYRGQHIEEALRELYRLYPGIVAIVMPGLPDTCSKCGMRVAATTAGRPDDPRSLRMPCKETLQ